MARSKRSIINPVLGEYSLSSFFNEAIDGDIQRLYEIGPKGEGGLYQSWNFPQAPEVT